MEMETVYIVCSQNYWYPLINFSVTNLHIDCEDADAVRVLLYARLPV
jgi:hypothetical protein